MTLPGYYSLTRPQSVYYDLPTDSFLISVFTVRANNYKNTMLLEMKGRVRV